MIIHNEITNALKSPVRQITASVIEYDGNNNNINTFYHNGILKSAVIDRVGNNSKFFGYGVCQKANIHLLDKNRELSISTANSFDILFSASGVNAVISNLPRFYTTEVHRDENTNELSVTAYDALYEAQNLTVENIGVFTENSPEAIVGACMAFLGGGLVVFENIPAEEYQKTYQNINLEGTETIRELLDMVAEVLQCVYFMRGNNIVFKRLDKDGSAVYTITKDDYITLRSGDNRRLTVLTATNNLGDAITASIDENIWGTTQFIRNNAIWEMQEDLPLLLEEALNKVYLFTLNQFECAWRGNWLLEIGDKIEFITKDNKPVSSYFLNDSIEYNGAYQQKTSWNYEDNEGETANNPSTIGEALKYTFAKVDKVNREITIVASEIDEAKTDISTLLLTTENINASVEKVEMETQATADSLGKEIVSLTNRVDATITADDVAIAVKTELENGVNKVITSTGFVFDEMGLTVSKSDSEMNTLITENGMIISKDNDEVLTANNKGVKAIDLHAETYLIVGDNSRFENYGSARTGCFWIG